MEKRPNESAESATDATHRPQSVALAFHEHLLKLAVEGPLGFLTPPPPPYAQIHTFAAESERLATRDIIAPMEKLSFPVIKCAQMEPDRLATLEDDFLTGYLCGKAHSEMRHAMEMRVLQAWTESDKTPFAYTDTTPSDTTNFPSQLARDKTS